MPFSAIKSDIAVLAMRHCRRSLIFAVPACIAIVYLAFTLDLPQIGLVLLATGVLHFGLRFRLLLRHGSKRTLLPDELKVVTSQIERQALPLALFWVISNLAVYPNMLSSMHIGYVSLVLGACAVSAFSLDHFGRLFIAFNGVVIGSLVLVSVLDPRVYHPDIAWMCGIFAVTSSVASYSKFTFLRRFSHVMQERDQERSLSAQVREQALVEAKAAARAAEDSAREARDVFVAKVSHEFRSPLQVITNGVDVLEMSIPERQVSLRNTVRRISNATSQLVRQANDLATYASSQTAWSPGLPTSISLAQLLSDVKDEQSFHLRNEVQIEVQSDNSTCLADSVRIRQVLTNLVSNACKYTDHGLIQIHAYVEHRQPEGSHFLHLTVSDTGIGIAPDALPFVWDPFTRFDKQRKVVGTGLGLAIVKTIVERLGGSISLTSELGRGSNFSVKIPVEVLEVMSP